MLGIFKNLLDSNEKQIKGYQKQVDQINELEEKYKDLSFEELREKTSELKTELEPLIQSIPEEQKISIKTLFIDNKKVLSKEEQAVQAKLLEIMPDAFAMVREVARRKMDRRHFDVQLIGGLVLAEGKIAELKTGEGKTQVAHLPLFLYGLTGRGAHLVTVNDYLTKRDGEYAGHILSELGLTLGIITSQGAFKFISDDEIKKYKGEDEYNERMKVKIQNPGDVTGANLIEVTKSDAYQCDIVYGTNNEFGFDYLRDNMVTDVKNMVQRELYFCIVDEVDSILIDEARTPLIISAPAEESNELYVQFAKVARQLDLEKDYEVDEKAHSAVLTDKGIQKVEKMLGVENLWEDYQLAHHLDNALKAQALYKRDDEYLVRDGEVLIVDSFTGRVLPGRRYSEGLHQAIEAKEGVQIQKESKTLATITFQNYFRLYKHLSGATGTAETEAEEFYKIYALDTVVVPTVRPVIRKDKTDLVYKNTPVKFKAVVEQVVERNKKGQPVLVGTTSVEHSEIVSELLNKKGVKHAVLNAKYHEKEAQIVANAGQKGSVTIATNMAGRGTDIKLGKGVKEVGGLLVIGTERHESRRIDNQLRGRSGRLGDPGESRFYVALDDEIMRIQGGDVVKRIMDTTKMNEDVPIEARIIGKTIENAQKRVEGMNFDIRKRVVEYDDVMNQQRMIFYQKRRNVIQNSDIEDVEVVENKENINSQHEMVLNALQKEVDTMAAKHYLDERGDDIDTEKMVADFLDLGDRDLLNKAYQKASGSPDSIEVLKEKTLSQDEIDEIFAKTIDEALKLKEQELGNEEYRSLIKYSYLEVMDQNWTDHLEAMQDLREGIGLRGYAQKEPLVEYKNEAFKLFENFINSVDSGFARRVLKVRRLASDPSQQLNQNLRTNIDQIEDILTGSRDAFGLLQKAVQTTINSANGVGVASDSQNSNQQGEKKVDAYKTIVNKQKVGRNDPCPCGSGKKYKNCGLINAPGHKA